MLFKDCCSYFVYKILAVFNVHSYRKNVFQWALGFYSCFPYKY